MFNRANGTAAILSDGFIPGTANHQISAMFRFKDNAADKMSKGAHTGWHLRLLRCAGPPFVFGSAYENMERSGAFSQ